MRGYARRSSLVEPPRPPPLSAARAPTLRAKVPERAHDARMLEALADRATRPVKAKAAVDSGYGDLIATARAPQVPIGRVDDPAEAEADRFAAFAVGETPAQAPPLAGGAAPLRRACAACAEEETGEVVRRSADPSSADGAPAHGAPDAELHGVSAVLASPGAPVPAPLRSWLEPLARMDLGAVRVHTDSLAAASARSLGARAWSYAGHIAFGPGEWAPDTAEGRRLMAHEVAHVAQGQGGEGALRRSVTASAPDEQAPVLPGERPVPGALPSSPPRAQSRPAPRAESCPPPRTMRCAPATSSPVGVTNTLLFPNDSAVLTPRQRAEIDAAAAAWHSAGGGVTVRVDGYASIDGPCGHNWSLSCARAQAVADELRSPSDGSPGVPSGSLEVFANGESNEAGGAIPPNRRTTIAMPLRPPAPTPPRPGPTFPILLGRARGCGSGPDFTHGDYPPRVPSVASLAKLEAWAALYPFSRSHTGITNLECELEMDAVLRVLGGSDGHAAFSRFVSGAGGVVTHGAASSLGRLALASGSFAATRAAVNRRIQAQLSAQAAAGALDPTALAVTPPPTYFSFSDGAALKAVIGGTQGETLFATSFVGDISTRTYTIGLEYRICDDFGVDETDLYAPGLFGFWVLQHERSGYVPFVNELVLTVVETGTF